MSNKKRIVFLFTGLLLFILCIVLLPESIFPDLKSRAAIGTVAWMAFWWITAPIDFAVTAFLPIAINAIIPMTDMNSVIANYASETILLLLGASILTASWEITGLDKRIAMKFLSVIGNNMRHQIIFWFMLSMILSSILPNAVVCATITPIAISMLKYVGEGDIANSKKGSLILLTVAYAAGVGGLATPLGGAMNLVTIEYIQQLTGQEYMYYSWVIRFLPIMILLVVSNLVILAGKCKKGETIGETKEYFAQMYRQMPPITKEEIMSLALFAIATILSFTRQLYQDLIPGLKPAYVFIICAILSFTITKKDGERFILWKTIQSKIVWELIYIFAGGLAVGTLIEESGAASNIGQAVSSMGLTGGLVTIIVIITMTIILSDITSNTATAAIAIPIVISVINGIGKNPIPYVYIASIGVNLSYMLPTSIRAIPVGYGLSPKYMFKQGVFITVVAIVLMTAISYVLLNFWPMFSVA